MSAIDVELLSDTNLHPLTKLTIEFWQDCNYEEELLNWRQIINVADNYCALAKLDERYVGFIHMTIRNDYVEGSNTDKTAYLEAIYIKPAYRYKNIATLLVNKSELWAKSKGFSQVASDTEFENLCSQQFHKKLGFKEVSRIVCYLKNV
ncbi:MAG: aminoglycoside 6'-N-acetyltransferase [Ferruginibacter sp.]